MDESLHEAIAELVKCRDILDRALEIHHRATASQPEIFPRAVFRREGDFWTLSLRGPVIRMRDAKGLHHIAYLLARPGEPVLARELAAAQCAHGDSPLTASTDGVRADLGDAGPVLDADARKQYRARESELRIEHVDARRHNDTERAARIESELEWLRHELAAALGLGERVRKAASHSERARLMVTKAIKAAIERVRANDAAFGRHLATSIKTGHICSYRPSPPGAAWEL